MRSLDGKPFLMYFQSKLKPPFSNSSSVELTGPYLIDKLSTEVIKEVLAQKKTEMEG